MESRSRICDPSQHWILRSLSVLAARYAAASGIRRKDSLAQNFATQPRQRARDFFSHMAVREDVLSIPKALRILLVKKP